MEMVEKNEFDTGESPSRIGNKIPQDIQDTQDDNDDMGHKGNKNNDGDDSGGTNVSVSDSPSASSSESSTSSACETSLQNLENDSNQVSPVSNKDFKETKDIRNMKKPEPNISPPELNGQVVDVGVGFDEEDESIFEVKMRKNRRSSSTSGSGSANGNRTKSNGTNNSNSNSNKNKRFEPSEYCCTYSHKNLTSTFPTSTGDNFSVTRGGDGETVRITGYLEKRSKVLGWKKFWFVLDGRLLTYYKSKSDYDSLSACCGSINLGIASTVRPIQIRGCKGHPIQIVTRSQVYYLKSPDKQILEQWLIAIQEAASSQPIISFPVWADPGAQFFRYSFAASSQWSLSTSTNDITESLKKLPQNFYLKGSSSKSNKVPNTLHKCHSFASLQSPSIYSTMSFKDRINNNSTHKNSNTNTKKLIKSDKISSSTSMLLESEQASAKALKEELSRKLSVGKSGDDTVKPSLTVSSNSINRSKSTAKDLPFLKNPVSSKADSESNHYDEIVDFEAIYENYEPCGDSNDSNSEERRLSDKSGGSSNTAESGDTIQVPGQNDGGSGIYESVESMSMEDCPKEKKNKHNSELRLSGGSNSNRKSNGSNDTSRDRSQSMTQSGHHGHAKTLKGPIPDSALQRKLSASQESESSSLHSSVHSSRDNVSDGGKGKKWKNKPFGGFFHKIFHRDKSSKDKSKGQNPPNSAIVITGPIDLRSLHRDDQNSPINRPTNLPINEVQKSSMGQKHSSPVGSKPAFDVNVMDELKLKVERISHTLPLTPVADHILSKVVGQQEHDPILEESSLNATYTKVNYNSKPYPKSKGNSGQSQIQIPTKDPRDDGLSPSEEKDTFFSEPVQRRRKSQSEDFQQKLAKFNRLSERLSSTFVAALNPTPIHYPTIGPIGRSRSCKVKKTCGDDCLPPLPPKMRDSPGYNVKLSFYDYPTNNRPVAEEEKVPEDVTIATFIRSLNKKNSAPDIIFSSSTSSSGESGISKEIEGDNVFEEILCPPPIPPKVRSAASSPLGSPSFPRNTYGLKGDYVVPHKNPVKVEEPPKEMAQSPVNPDKDKNLIQSKPPQSKPLIPSKPLILAKPTLTSPESKSPTNLVPKSKSDSKSAQILPYKNQVQKIPNFIDDSLDGTSCSLSLSPTTTTPSTTSTPQHSSELSESSSVYENLKFATLNTLVQEFETVEETADEISEMYDDFPSEFVLGGTNSYESTSPSSLSSESNNFLLSPDENSKDVRHSGIDQLQMFLSLEDQMSSGDFTSETDEHSVPTLSVFKKSPVRAGAVSRLGHSSAIEQLNRIVNTAKTEL